MSAKVNCRSCGKEKFLQKENLYLTHDADYGYAVCFVCENCGDGQVVKMNFVDLRLGCPITELPWEIKKSS